MFLDHLPSFARWGIFILAMVFGAFTASLIIEGVPPQVSQWFSSHGQETNLSAAELAERVLQPSDLPGNYTIVERRVRDVSEISAIGRELGWKRGFIVRYQLSGTNAFCPPTIQQTISVYPRQNVTRALPHTPYHRRMAKENNESVIVEELPYPGIGDESTATRFSQQEFTCDACLFDFIRNDLYSQVMVYGPAPDCEIGKNLAAKAAAKLG